MGADDFYLLRT